MNYVGVLGRFTDILGIHAISHCLTPWPNDVLLVPNEIVLGKNA